MKNKLIVFLALMVITQTAQSAEDVNPIENGKFFGQIRYRYEYVNQNGLPDNAKASVARTNLGFKSGKFYKTQILGEAQIISNIGADDYNDTMNDKTRFPVVNEPVSTEVNRVWISWDGIPGTRIKLGRQHLNINNQRFISSSDWRQNDVTYDGVSIENKLLKDTKLTYAYVGNVNRHLGNHSPAGDLDSQIHIANVEYDPADWLNLAAYALLLDFKRAQATSNKTFGVRARGDVNLDKNYSLTYEAEFAKQYDYSTNPADYSENYYRGSAGITGFNYKIDAGYELLGGNGRNRVQVPLTHWQPFNGRVEKFIPPPLEGLEDKFIRARYKYLSNNQWLNGIVLEGEFHKFDGDKSKDFGSEFDVSIGKNFKTLHSPVTDSIDVLLQYGDYNAEDLPYTDTDIMWLQLSLNY